MTNMIMFMGGLMIFGMSILTGFTAHDIPNPTPSVQNIGYGVATMEAVFGLAFMALSIHYSEIFKRNKEIN